MRFFSLLLVPFFFLLALAFDQSIYSCSYSFDSINVKLDKKWEDEADLTFFKFGGYAKDLKSSLDRPFKCWREKSNPTNITCQGVNYTGLFNAANGDDFQFITLTDNNEYTYQIEDGKWGYWCVSADFNAYQNVLSKVEFTKDGSNGKSFVVDYRIFWLLMTSLPIIAITVFAVLYLKLEFGIVLVMCAYLCSVFCNGLELSLGYLDYSDWILIMRFFVFFLRLAADIYAIVALLNCAFSDIEGCGLAFGICMFVKFSSMVETEEERGMNSLMIMLPSSSVAFNAAQNSFLILTYLIYATALLAAVVNITMKLARLEKRSVIMEVFFASFLIWLAGEMILRTILIFLVDVKFVDSFKYSFFYWLFINWTNFLAFGAFAVVCYWKLKEEPNGEYSMTELPK